MTTRNSVHIPQISCSVLGLHTDEVYPCKIMHSYSSQMCEDLKNRIFVQRSKLCCVNLTKQIFMVLYMYFTSYLYIVIINFYVVLPMLEEIYAISGMMFSL